MKLRALLNLFSKNKEELNIGKLYESLEIGNTSFQPKVSFKASSVSDFEWVYDKPVNFTSHSDSILNKVTITSNSLDDLTNLINKSQHTDYNEKLEIIRIISNYEDKQNITNNDINWSVTTLQKNQENKENFQQNKPQYLDIYTKTQKLIDAVKNISSTNVVTKDEKINLQQSIQRLEIINHNFNAALLNQDEFIRYQDSLNNRLSIFTSSKIINIDNIKRASDKLDFLQKQDNIPNFIRVSKKP